MKPTVFAISVLFAAMLPAGWAWAQDPESAAESSSPDPPILFILSGRVTDEITGRPLAGARIGIPGTGRSGETDSTGMYHLEWRDIVYRRESPVNAVLPLHQIRTRTSRTGFEYDVFSPGGTWLRSVVLPSEPLFLNGTEGVFSPTGEFGEPHVELVSLLPGI